MPRLLYFIENQQIKNNKCQTRNLVIDARIKPHHAPVLEKDAEIEKRLTNYLARVGNFMNTLRRRGSKSK